MCINFSGLYGNTTGVVSDVHKTHVTPTTWALYMWALIYFWQAAWLIYAVGTTVDILPRYTYILYVITNIAHVCWLVAWSWELMVWALIIIIIATVTLYFATAGSCLSAKDKADVFSSSKLSAEVWLMRGLVQNGLALYSAWFSVATLLNLTIVLGEESRLSMSTASTVSLTVFCVEIIGWFLVDVFSLDQVTRYVITPYFVYVVALSAIYDNNHDLDKNDKALLTIYVLNMVCLMLACFLFVSKIIITIRRHTKSTELRRRCTL